MIRSWRSTLTALGVAAAVASSGGAAEAASCGNADNSGQAAINDVILILRAQSDVLLRPTLCGGAGYNNCADVNANGQVDISDVVQLLREISRLPSCLPPPCVSSGNNLAGCPGTATLPGSITANAVIPAGCDARISGVTFVEPGVVLTIRPGAVVKGTAGQTPPATLIVKTGAKINAVGTAAAPIVFTSTNGAGARNQEDWGGVALLGRATVNVPPDASTTLEGLPPDADLVCGKDANGNRDVNDNSGCLRFVRIEFAGRDLSPNNELNLLVLCGVGRGTQIDHVQAHFGADDCVEWFGSTVNTKFMIASACGDDGFDTQLGTQSALQFGLVTQRLGNIEADSHGLEMDNIDPALASTDTTPVSNVKYCNLTMCGIKGQAGSPASTAQIGIRSRRGNSVTVANSIISSFSNGANGGGLSLQDPATTGHMCAATCAGGSNPGATCRQASDCTGGTCTFANARATLASPFALGAVGVVRNSLFFNNGSSGSAHGFNVSACDTAGECACTSAEYFSFIDANENVEGAAADPMNICGGAFPAANPVPGAGTLADTHPAADCTTIDGSFESASYIGAFAPGGANWTQPWASFPSN